MHCFRLAHVAGFVAAPQSPRWTTSRVAPDFRSLYPVIVRQVPFEERNKTAKSQGKVKSLAKRAGLPLPLVQALVSHSWNYDDDNFCWVPEEQKHEIPETAVAVLEEGLGWERGRRLSADEVVAVALAFAERGMRPHVERFMNAVPVHNRWAMSPFMTAATLHGLSKENVASCPSPRDLDFARVCAHAGAKLGLSLRPRTDLGFAAVEAATLNLGTPPPPSDSSWLGEVCSSIQALGSKSGLSDLIKATAKPLGGNKSIRANVLEALALVGVLRTDAFNPGHDFLPAVQRDSPHFYSNEWRFPMNFWAESGSVAGPEVLLSLLES
jgi:hypothetical protein